LCLSQCRHVLRAYRRTPLSSETRPDSSRMVHGFLFDANARIVDWEHLGKK
jgi:hypothetical protein